MEEKKPKEERTLVINIKLTRKLVAVLIAASLVVAFVGYLALGQRKVSASPAAPEAPEASTASSSGLRKFYRTKDAYTPTLASTACAPGYHFASIWELLDPSNLEYAGELPDAWVGPLYDMGEGPPTGSEGWPLQAYVRTGYNADVSGVRGQANCNGWTSDDPSDYGTMASLTHEWGSAEDLFVWDIGLNPCKTKAGVWCVED
jgi:hypothetical protein